MFPSKTPPKRLRHIVESYLDLDQEETEFDDCITVVSETLLTINACLQECTF